MPEIILGAGGNELEEGSRVHPLTQPHRLGRVTRITDEDADYDDVGGPYQIPPAVHVLFDDGEEDEFPATGPRFRGEDPWECEELVLVKEATTRDFARVSFPGSVS